MGKWTTPNERCGTYYYPAWSVFLNRKFADRMSAQNIQIDLLIKISSNVESKKK